MSVNTATLLQQISDLHEHGAVLKHVFNLDKLPSLISDGELLEHFALLAITDPPPINHLFNLQATNPNAIVSYHTTAIQKVKELYELVRHSYLNQSRLKDFADSWVSHLSYLSLPIYLNLDLFSRLIVNRNFTIIQLPLTLDEVVLRLCTGLIANGTHLRDFPPSFTRLIPRALMLAYAGTHWHTGPTTSRFYTRRSIQFLHEAMLAFEYNDFVTIIKSQLPKELADMCIADVPRVRGLPKIGELTAIWVPWPWLPQSQPIIASQTAIFGPIIPQYDFGFGFSRRWDSILRVFV